MALTVALWDARSSASTALSPQREMEFRLMASTAGTRIGGRDDG
jgi:hypothetical protein